MRSHGWAGNRPASDEEAIARILDAADQIVAERGPTMRIADVARTLGVTRQTVYRYFPSADALLVATGMRSADGLLARVAAHVKGIRDPVTAMIEGVAFSIEALATDNQVEFVLSQRDRGGRTAAIMSETAMSFGRTMLRKFDVDWAEHGFDEDGLEELAEFSLRILQSFLADPGRRSGAELRRYLTRWVGPGIALPRLPGGLAALGASEPRRGRRRPPAAS